MRLEYIPETLTTRYDWLIMGNPAGKTRWFLALDNQTKNLIGFITIMSRQFIWKLEKVLFGIMGDFVVEKRHQGFGPGIQLPRQVPDKAKDLGFSLVYTITHNGTLKIVERAGFRNKVQLGWIVKPLVFDRYVRNPVAAWILNIAVLLFDKVYHVVFLNPVMLRYNHFEVTDVIDTAFDTF